MMPLASPNRSSIPLGGGGGFARIAQYNAAPYYLPDIHRRRMQQAARQAYQPPGPLPSAPSLPLSDDTAEPPPPPPPLW